MSAKKLRKKLLTDAEPVIDHVVAEATGRLSPLAGGDVDKGQLEKVWAAIVPMMQKESDIVKIGIETTHDVIQGVCDGKITLPEARELMTLLRDQQDIELLPELIEKLENAEAE